MDLVLEFLEEIVVTTTEGVLILITVSMEATTRAVITPTTVLATQITAIIQLITVITQPLTVGEETINSNHMHQVQVEVEQILLIQVMLLVQQMDHQTMDQVLVQVEGTQLLTTPEVLVEEVVWFVETTKQ